MDEEKARGSITTEHTFWCGNCAEWMQVCAGKKYLAIPEAKVAGWRLTCDKGWICPKCVKEHAAAM